MAKGHINCELIWQAAGGVFALLTVTAAGYIWHLPQSISPQAVFVTYIISISLMGVCSFVIFRIAVRQGYASEQHLSPVPFFLQMLIWGLFFAFPCIYNPIKWAWSRSQASSGFTVLNIAGWTCVVVGLALLLVALGRLGLPRSLGVKSRQLETSGLYRVSRNPQILGGALLIVGYFFLWPSWYAVGWLVLFSFTGHMMISTEEEYLRCAYRKDYEEYCKQAPRYLRFR